MNTSTRTSSTRTSPTSTPALLDKEKLTAKALHKQMLNKLREDAAKPTATATAGETFTPDTRRQMLDKLRQLSPFTLDERSPDQAIAQEREILESMRDDQPSQHEPPLATTYPGSGATMFSYDSDTINDTPDSASKAEQAAEALPNQEPTTTNNEHSAELSHLRGIVDTYLQPNWWQRLLASLFGSGDMRALHAEITSLQSALLKGSNAVADNLDQLKDTCQHLAKSIETRIERDQLLKQVATLEASITEHIRANQGWHNHSDKLKAEHAAQEVGS